MGRWSISLRYLTITAVFVLVVAACGDDDSGETTSPPETTSLPPSETTSSPPTTQVVIDIGIFNFAFRPRSLTIPVGTTLTWTNDESRVTHTTTSEDELWDQTLAPAGSFSKTFDTPGTFRYFCNLHPSMTASITVGG